jgi:hypothetical protein
MSSVCSSGGYLQLLKKFMAKLFIYLPTYNRPESLRRQLSVLLPQVEKFPQDVRVLICDNDSSKYTLDEMLRWLPALQNVEDRRNGGDCGEDNPVFTS